MKYLVGIEDERNYGIYKITNTINGKVYIGQTRSGFRKRYMKHINSFKHNKGHTKKFYDDYIKYGPDSFVFEIVQIENDVSKLDDLEIKYIKQYNSIESGYNTLSGGNYYYKDKETKYLKKNVSNPDNSFREKRSEYMKTRIVSTDTKERLKFLNTGSKSPVTSLNEDVVKQIKQDLVSGYTIAFVSKKYSTSTYVVSGIANNRSWRHVFVEGWDKYLLKKKKHIRFSNDDVRNIRKLLDEGYSENKIAKMYGCCSSKINDIHRGITYKDVI